MGVNDVKISSDALSLRYAKGYDVAPLKLDGTPNVDENGQAKQVSYEAVDFKVNIEVVEIIESLDGIQDDDHVILIVDNVTYDAYGEGEHRWNPALLATTQKYNFKPKACRPYRAKTKGKVERFNSYLKSSFVTPLAATMKQHGLELTVDVLNGHIGAWLAEVAHQRVHATTGESHRGCWNKNALPCRHYLSQLT